MEWKNTNDAKPHYGQVVKLKIDGAIQDSTFIFDGADNCSDWFEVEKADNYEDAVFDNSKHNLEWMEFSE